MNKKGFGVDAPSRPIPDLKDRVCGRATHIKIDCQGADYHVLLGAEETIRSSGLAIVFGFEHYLEQGRPIVRENYENLMFQLGYTTTAISNKGDGRQIDFPAVPAG